MANPAAARSITLLHQPYQALACEVAGGRFITGRPVCFCIEVLPFVRIHNIEADGAIGHRAEDIIPAERPKHQPHMSPCLGGFVVALASRVEPVRPSLLLKHIIVHVFYHAPRQGCLPWVSHKFSGLL